LLRLRLSTSFAIRAGFSVSTSLKNFLLSAGFGPFRPIGRWERSAMRGAFGLLLCSLVPAATESAVANGDTRTIDLYNAHTHESIQATYRVNGQYDPAVLEKLNWFLRDWRLNESTHMDPRLFDAVWETYREAGATTPIRVVCGYRSPKTNAMLRRRSRAVAEHSQHMLGKAMDTEMPGMSMEKVREVAMRLALGGVGFYGDSSFIHIDVGNVRYWPRMTYAQLEHVFPDGKTVLIPANGKPLPGYEVARAELASAGRVAQTPPPQPGRPNFLAWLFGGSKSADESEEEAAQQVAASHTAAPPAIQVAAAETAAAEPETDSKDESALTLVSLPVPPHRPDDFMTLANAVPLPPDRPADSVLVSGPSKIVLAKAVADPIGALLKTSPPDTAQAADLPAIITHGVSKGAAPQTGPHVLAYASMARMEGLRSALRGNRVRKASRPTASSAAARATLSNPQIAKLDRGADLAPKLTGLRQAARLQTAALSQKLAAGYLARFSTVASNLPTDHFSGPAIIGLRSADRSHMVFVDSAVALNKDH